MQFFITDVWKGRSLQYLLGKCHYDSLAISHFMACKKTSIIGLEKGEKRQKRKRDSAAGWDYSTGLERYKGSCFPISLFVCMVAI